MNPTPSGSPCPVPCPMCHSGDRVFLGRMLESPIGSGEGVHCNSCGADGVLSGFEVGPSPFDGLHGSVQILTGMLESGLDDARGNRDMVSRGVRRIMRRFTDEERRELAFALALFVDAAGGICSYDWHRNTFEPHEADPGKCSMCGAPLTEHERVACCVFPDGEFPEVE